MGIETRPEKFYREVRCNKCRRLLLKEYVYRGRIAVKCTKCSEVVEIDFKTPIGTIERLEGRKH